MHRMIIDKKHDLTKADNSVGILQRGLFCLLQALERIFFFRKVFDEFNIACTLFQETTF